MQSMTRYVIHIGPAKTGTTYLQHAFTGLRPALRQRRINYPDAWGGIHGHHALTQQLARGEDAVLEATFAALASDPGVDTILLSSETLAALDDRQVGRLKGFLRDAPVAVVFYCRRWSELVPSNWREVVKQGSRESLQGFILKYMTHAAGSEIVNFALVLERYARVFGAGSLRVASYNGVLEAGEDLLAHFCRCFLDWPEPPPCTLGRVNTSIDMVDSEMLRTLNALEWLRAGDDAVGLFERYAALKPTLPIAWIVEQSMQFAVNRVRIDDTAAGMGALHDRIATQYRYALVTPCPRGRLFEPRSTDVLYVHPDFVLRPGILAAMRDIHARLLTVQATG
jgi:hypothetical protein